MAALAYILLPVSGAIAYFGGSSPRVRFHGLQAIVYSVVWVSVLYACTRVSDRATQLAFAVGGAVWLLLITVTAIGRDVPLPVVGRWLRAQAQSGPDGASTDEP